MPTISVHEASSLLAVPPPRPTHCPQSAIFVGGHYEVGSSSNRISGFRQTAIANIARCPSPPLACDHSSCHTRGGRPHVSPKLTGSSGCIFFLDPNFLAASKNSIGVPELTAVTVNTGKGNGRGSGVGTWSLRT